MRDVPTVQEDKAVLRARLLAARARLSAEQRTGAGRAIRDALLSRPEVQMAGTIAAYYSVGAEPDTRGLVYALWKRGSYVLLPVLLADGDLDWASYEGPDSMLPGPRGLLEPGEPPRGIEAVARADAVLVPALAVDRGGNRLGRGGGSYDRVLARVGPLIPLIALIYDDELLDHVPAERHDVPVRAAVSPLTGMTVLAPGDTLLPRDPAELPWDHADPGKTPGPPWPGPHSPGTPHCLSRGPHPYPGNPSLSRGPILIRGTHPRPRDPSSSGGPILVRGTHPHPRDPSSSGGTYPHPRTHPPIPWEKPILRTLACSEPLAGPPGTLAGRGIPGPPARLCMLSSRAVRVLI